MSDESAGKPAEAFEAAQSAVEDAMVDLQPAMTGPDTALSADIALQELKTEVLSAVRGAITGVMSRHQPQLSEPDLDMDFSLSAADPPAAPEAEPGPISEPLLMSLPELEPYPQLTAVIDSPAPQARHAVALLPPLKPIRPQRTRALPAWTAAALLSVTGVAIGAGVAILMVDPAATLHIRQRVQEQASLVLAMLGSDASSTPEAHETETVTLESDAKYQASDLAGTAGTHPRVDTALVTGSTKSAAMRATSARASGAVSAKLAFAAAGSTIRLTMDRTAAAMRQSQIKIAEELTQRATDHATSSARMVKVATAGDAAAFAQTLMRPVKAGEAVSALKQTTGIDVLAALPATASLVAPSGAELAARTQAASPGLAPAAEDAAANPAVEEPQPSPTVLSAMARANAAMHNGDVEAARMLLQSESEAGQVEAMLALARSYDPSYLKQLGVDVAKGDAVAAEKLYRAWYHQSVKLGLVSEGVNLKGLIRAMARAKP